MNGLQRVGGVVMIHGTAARVLAEAVLIAERARRSSGLPCSADYTLLVRELLTAVSAAGQCDVAPPATPQTELVQPTVPVEQAAKQLGKSRRQTQRMAAELGGKLIGGRWLLDAQAIREHIEGRTA